MTMKIQCNNSGNPSWPGAVRESPKEGQLSLHPKKRKIRERSLQIGMHQGREEHDPGKKEKACVVGVQGARGLGKQKEKMIKK